MVNKESETSFCSQLKSRSNDKDKMARKRGNQRREMSIVLDMDKLRVLSGAMKGDARPRAHKERQPTRRKSIPTPRPWEGWESKAPGVSLKAGLQSGAENRTGRAVGYQDTLTLEFYSVQPPLTPVFSHTAIIK